MYLKKLLITLSICVFSISATCAGTLNSDEEVNIFVYEQINPAIVAIDADVDDGVSSGTGCVITSDGYILTGSHVIEGCTSVNVITSTGQNYKANVVAQMGKNKDLAILKINPKKPLKNITITVDAGHGGTDYGAIREGINEKDITTDVSNRVAKILRSDGYKVYMTREEDKTLSLQERVDFAEENDLTYINFLKAQDEIGLDWSKDTYDGGLHLNLAGAEKLSQYFGEILSEDMGVPDRRNEENLQKYWADVINRYEAEIARQEANLEKYGSVHEPE